MFRNGFKVKVAIRTFVSEKTDHAPPGLAKMVISRSRELHRRPEYILPITSGPARGHEIEIDFTMVKKVLR